MSSTISPLLRTDLDGVFRPRSVAIYGISERTSQRIAENMTVPGVPFYGINPPRRRHGHRRRPLLRNDVVRSHLFA